MFIDVHGITLGYDDVGTGIPVVLLHGFPFNRAMWSKEREALSGGYRVITPDLRGFGRSSGTDKFSIGDLADDVIGLLDQLSIKQAVIGGLSMGGYVALNLVRRYPERVLALMLFDTKATADSDEAKRNRNKVAAMVVKDGMQPLVDQMLPKLLDDQAGDVARFLTYMMLATNPRTAAAASIAMGHRDDSTPDLPAIKVPTIIVVGDDDKITPPSESEAMQLAIPFSRLVRIPHAGHVSNLEHPQAFAMAVHHFLDECFLQK
ncbi:MAG: alpha/beta fold hydrolase [Herpetosiphon sp.]|nr:alpha/beta fold hydrolase [Herpetosiphon sp.]